MNGFLRNLERSIRDFDGVFGFLEDEEFFPDFHSDFPYRRPLTDLQETEKEVKIHYEIPGVDKKDIQLSITGNQIEVSVEKKQEIGHRREYTRFYRRTTLPVEVVSDKATATYKDGILEVTMLKSEKPKRGKIEIS